MTSRGVQTQLTEEQFKRFVDDVRCARGRLVAGTPEKYPAAEARVRILDAEALADAYLAQREALKEIAEHPVNSETDPCDWHCTRKLTDIARAAVSVGSPETGKTRKSISNRFEKNQVAGSPETRETEE